MPSKILHNSHFKIRLISYSLVYLFLAAPLDVSSQKQSTEPITVVTYNTWGLPIWLPKIQRKKRYPQIVDTLNAIEPSLIFLQECFHKKWRRQLKNSFEDKYHEAVSFDCNQGGLVKQDCTGGLQILSKFPISDFTFHPYGKYEGMKLSEKKGAKGFLYCRVSINNQVVNLVNTHLYSGRSTDDEMQRMHQARELLDFINTLDKSVPIILCGDFNIEHPTLSNKENSCPVYEAIKAFGFVDFLNQSPVPLSYNPEENRYANVKYYRKEGQQKLDFIWFKEGGTQLKCTEQKIIFTAPPLSDHYGVFGAFNIGVSQ